jgi:hypothetical protein
MLHVPSAINNCIAKLKINERTFAINNYIAKLKTNERNFTINNCITKLKINERSFARIFLSISPAWVVKAKFP